MNDPLRWVVATVFRLDDETAGVRSITFEVPGWRGHRAGQHVDIRLTASDGYVAQRSYSIASPASTVGPIQLTVERVDHGEVSPFLLDQLCVGDSIELRGPIGGYFTWSPGKFEPLLLIAGGSGIVPLMSILRTRAAVSSTVPARLLYSSRSEQHIIYRSELHRLHVQGYGFILTHTLTRQAPNGWTGERGRIGRAMLTGSGWPPHEQPDIFICGPTPFVESVTDHLVAMGHHESSIRTERFGPTGDIQ